MLNRNIIFEETIIMLVFQTAQ